MQTQSLISKFYYSNLFGSIFHTLHYCLKSELSDCQTVLDLGCGPSSPLKYISWIKSSTGVETHKPYLIHSKKQKIHTNYFCQKITQVDFPSKSFDAVLMLEVIEHLPSQEGVLIIKKAEKWARKKIIITSPNGFVPQSIVDNNPYQCHLSGWDLKKMKFLGFKCRGLAGLKILRQANPGNTMGDDLTISIKYRPRFFWFIIAALSQIICYPIPHLAFELFSVKKINNS